MEKAAAKYNDYHRVVIVAWPAADTSKWMPSHFLYLQLDTLSSQFPLPCSLYTGKVTKSFQQLWINLNLPLFMQILYTTSGSWYLENACYSFLMELVTCFKIYQFSIQCKGDKHSASIYLTFAVLSTPSKINIFRSSYLFGSRNCQTFFLKIFAARALIDLRPYKTDSQINWGWKATLESTPPVFSKEK